MTIKTLIGNNQTVVDANLETVKDVVDLLGSWINSDQDKLFKSTYKDSIVMVNEVRKDLNLFIEDSINLNNIWSIGISNLQTANGRYSDFKDMVKFMFNKNVEAHGRNLITTTNSLMDLASQFNDMYAIKQPQDILDGISASLFYYNKRVSSILNYQTFDHPTIGNYNFRNYLLGRDTLYLREYIRAIEINYLKI